MYEKNDLNWKNGLILDKNFKPAAVEYEMFQKSVRNSRKGVPLVIALENSNGDISTFKTSVFSDDSDKSELNNFYIERLIKALLWSRGGWKIIIGGSKKIYNFIKKVYSIDGSRSFDVNHMNVIYKKPFTIEYTGNTVIGSNIKNKNPQKHNLDGNRIGFDLGASDRKVSAVINGKTVFSLPLNHQTSVW